MDYSGKVLINTRNVKPISDILNDVNPPTGNNINLLLSFISTYAMSNGLLYDSSVPDKFVVPIQKSFADLGIINDVKAMKPIAEDEFESMVSESMNQCSDEIIEAVNSSKFWNPTPEKDADVFFQYLHRINIEKSDSTKFEIAYEAYNSDFMGGKFLVGLVDPTNRNVLQHLIDKDGETGQRAKVFSAAIGTFRTFLLSNMASRNNALFSTNPNFVKTLERKNIKTWGTIMERFNVPERFNKNCKSEEKDWRWKYPLVGAAVIIDAAKSNDIGPKELLTFSKKSKPYWKISALHKELLKRYCNAVSPGDIIDQMDDLWQEILISKSDTDYKSLFKSGLIFTVAPNLICAGLEEVTSIDHIPILAGPTLNLLFLAYNCYSKKVSYLNAISNLSSYDEKVINSFQSDLEKIWKHR